MGFSRELVQGWLKRESVQPLRRKRGTGDLAKAKAWACEQMRGPGWFLACRIVSPNRKTHWAALQRRYAMPRTVLAGWLSRQALPLPATITLTRYGRKPFDSHDNLRMAWKPLVDEIAKAFRVPDCDARLTWAYRQEPAPYYGVRIEIEPRTPATPGKE